MEMGGKANMKMKSNMKGQSENFYCKGAKNVL